MLARIFTLTSNSPSSATAASTSCRCSRAALRCSSVRANAPASSCVGSDGAPITSGMKKPEPSRSLSTRTRSSIGIISSPGPVLITPIWPRAPCARSQAVNWVSLIWRSVLVPMPTRTWMRSRSSSVKGIGVGSLPSSHDGRPPDRRPLGLGHCRECEERGPAAPIRSQDGEAPLLIVLRYDNLVVQIPDHDAADVGRLARDLECLDQEPRLSVLGDVGGVLVHRQRCRVTRLRTRMAGLQNGQVLVRCDVPCTCLTRQVLFAPQLICLNLALIAGRHGLHERLELARVRREQAAAGTAIERRRVSYAQQDLEPAGIGGVDDVVELGPVEHAWCRFDRGPVDELLDPVETCLLGIADDEALGLRAEIPHVDLEAVRERAGGRTRCRLRAWCRRTSLLLHECIGQIAGWQLARSSDALGRARRILAVVLRRGDLAGQVGRQVLTSQNRFQII